MCFLDLDTYKSPAHNWPRQQILSTIHDLCRSVGIPSPSLIIFSGQGYQVKWLLNSYLPREALVRWNIVQERLLDLFDSLGADPSAKDAARILRLVGTTNMKSGKKVEVVYVNGRTVDTANTVDFEMLAQTLLPLDRQRKSVKPDAEAKAPLQVVSPGSSPAHSKIIKGINTRVLAWDRLHDLRQLAQIRGGIGEGMRNSYLLVVACQMALSGLIYPQNFKSEVRALQAEISKDPKWLRDRDLLGSLQARVDAHHRKEKIEFNGKLTTPIYTYRTSTIINLLKITGDEQQQLKTLISSAMATERNTLRERAKRRAAGVVDRAEYIEQRKLTAAERRSQIQAMHAQGLTALQIAAHLDISKSTVIKAIAYK